MFYFDNFFGKKILKSTLLKDYDCFFTTRDFVLTPSNRTDLEELANKNRKFLKDKLMVANIISAVQTHSDNIQILNSDCTLYENTDALISNSEEDLFIMNFADCVPIILYDKINNIGAIVHAGWRGTAQKIAYKTVSKIVETYNTKPQNLVALIGPSIGQCCFETGEDAFSQLIKKDKHNQYYKKVGDKYFIDLKQLNKQQLLDCGLIEIDICDYCTCCMSDIFFSYRKEKGITARHSAVVKIKRG